MARMFSRGAGITRVDVHETDDMMDVAHFVEEGGGLFGAVSLSIVRCCESIVEAVPWETKAPEDSELWFARVILNRVRSAKAAIEQGDADRAAQFAFEAGLETARAVLKWRWESDALRGERVAGGARNAAHQTNDRHARLRERRFARMGDLAPAIGVEEAAKICEAEGLGSWPAIKRQWNRKKIRDT